jgi:ubiquinone/menaquinone biosynthesis C-methylase UbiE
MAESDAYVTAEYIRKAAELTRTVKQRTYELMHISPGATVLDIGCGPAIDTVALAKLVGPHGSVTGVDNDDEMLDQADAYAKELGLEMIVRHVRGDIAGLPFDDAVFDACRAERLLQVLPASYQPHAVLSEMIRVVKKRGWVVIADTDWATASIDFSDPRLERRLLTFFADAMRPNGYAGRQLHGLIKRSGLANIFVEPFPLLQTHLSQTPFGPWIQHEALKARVASAGEIRSWKEELEKRDKEGEFFSCLTMIVTAGQKQ